MSVQTQINRIKINVANALSALARKGVAVPNGANSDNLEELIDAVPTGGANAADATAVATDIISGKTAYGATGKVTGTLVVQTYHIMPTDPDNSFGNDGDLCVVMVE